MFAFLRGFAVGLEGGAAGSERHLIRTLSLCFGVGSAWGLALGAALSSRPGVSPVLPGLRVVAAAGGGTHELWHWGTLWLRRGTKSTQTLLPHTLGHLAGLCPGPCSSCDPESSQQLCWLCPAVLLLYPWFHLPGLVLPPVHPNEP